MYAFPEPRYPAGAASSESWAGNSAVVAADGSATGSAWRSDHGARHRPCPPAAPARLAAAAHRRHRSGAASSSKAQFGNAPDSLRPRSADARPCGSGPRSCGQTAAIPDRHVRVAECHAAVYGIALGSVVSAVDGCCDGSFEFDDASRRWWQRLEPGRECAACGEPCDLAAVEPGRQRARVTSSFGARDDSPGKAFGGAW